jgi:hypothetical protein
LKTPSAISPPSAHLRSFIVYPCNDLLHSSEENPG